IMPFGFMDSKELARFLGDDARRIDKLAQRGSIPCQKVNGVFRFNRAEITVWLQQQFSGLAHGALKVMDDGMSSHRNVESQLIVSPMLRKSGIALSLPARTKRSVLKELVKLASETELLYDSETLEEELVMREDISSTALEDGFAIPHPRRPQQYIIAEPILVFGRTLSSIAFGASDGSMSDLFFMVCSNDDQHHLHILARLCRLFCHKGFGDSLREAESEAEILGIIEETERAVLK
ncbi:MAG: PTS sugar transporter subunit IIA, partial [Sedimentisphaerales bacterium]|nr:PTS sugar transporter subunit IIA [Sedimentisphaerales bacterium]